LKFVICRVRQITKVQSIRWLVKSANVRRSHVHCSNASQHNSITRVYRRETEKGKPKKRKPMSRICGVPWARKSDHVSACDVAVVDAPRRAIHWHTFCITYRELYQHEQS